MTPSSFGSWLPADSASTPLTPSDEYAAVTSFMLPSPGPSSETNGGGEWTFYDDNPPPTSWPHGTPRLIGPPETPPGGDAAVVQLAGLDDSMALSPWIYGTW